MIKLSDREVRQKFLQCNYSILSSCFWHFRQQKGEGLLVIILDEYEDTLQLEYETNLSELFSEKTLNKKVYPKINTYNCNEELLVAFQLKSERKMNADNCILHSIGSSNFPVKVAAEVARILFQNLQSEKELCTA
ncbi:hypothetical protein [Crocosphaera chwakensis]|uniref:Uncharacterized protein n=1 Tax=Crocosphaera chwakensis CCY0110 TaxID=391612 RepID=A3IH15_9CHRO|nr:hypothetical protein [Crocosphaera chwakensis]EAZ94257.1 hypothetical protein CY0110_10292 [Crocosphaera chwakensis CCY0110]